MWCKNPADLYRLCVFIQNDINPPEGYADAAYLFGHTKYFEKPILEKAARLYPKRTKRFYICKLAPGYPYNGTPGNPIYRDFEAWRDELIMRLVPRECIHPIVSPYPTQPEEKFPVSHTGTEAERFIKLAQENKWKSVYVVAHPIHILRAFTLTVTFAIRAGNIKVYAKTGRHNRPWSEKVVANQGIVEGTYFRAANDGEWERLNKVYNNKYDPISAEELINYIEWRDTLV